MQEKNDKEIMSDDGKVDLETLMKKGLLLGNEGEGYVQLYDYEGNDYSVIHSGEHTVIALGRDDYDDFMNDDED